LRFISAIEKSPQLITEITKNWTKLLEFSEKITVKDEEKFKILEKVSKELVKKYKQANTIDGVRVDWENGEWAIIRCSNTSPKISVRIEAVDKISLEKKKTEILKVLNKYI
jgi:phosphomannomutase